MNIVYVTGNAGKAKYFSELIGLDIKHYAADTHEIQSLDLEEIIKHKAKEAFDQIKKPIIIEDTSLIINSMGSMPGPLIKWFLDELGTEKICRLTDWDQDRSARAECVFAYYDGTDLKIFKSGLDGTISDTPKGSTGFGWNPIFIPEKTNRTMGEITDSDFKDYYLKIKPIFQVRDFLLSLDNR